MLEEFDGTETLCVSLERKNKTLVFTKDKGITLNDRDEIVAEFHEALQTTATLFKDNKTGGWKVRLGPFYR
jgi:hypothetical protein